MPDELVPAQRYSLSDLKGISQVFAASGYFKDAREASQAFVKIMAGQELGIPPMQAMIGYHIVEGKPVASATLIGALIKRHPAYDYTINVLTDDECSLQFWQDGEASGLSRFTIADAKQAGVVRPGGGWAKYPRNMLFARAISNGAKWFCPDVFSSPIYVAEELGVEVDDEKGDIVVLEPVSGEVGHSAVTGSADMVGEPVPPTEPPDIVGGPSLDDLTDAELDGLLEEAQHDLMADAKDSGPGEVSASAPADPGPERRRAPEARCDCGHAKRSHPDGGACKVGGCECAAWNEVTVVAEAETEEELWAKQNADRTEDLTVTLGVANSGAEIVEGGPTESVIVDVSSGLLVRENNTLEQITDVIARLQAANWLTKEQMQGALIAEFRTPNVADLTRPQQSDLLERLLRYEQNQQRQEELA